MSIVTLTTDLGNRDYYVGAVKAAIVSRAPGTTIVDITHMVKPFDTIEGAFHLRSVWNHFPLGTVHILGILPEFAINRPQLCIVHMGHYFLCTDNGAVPFLFDIDPEEVFEINLPQGDEWKFPLRGVYATAAAHLCRGGTPEFLGKRTEGIKSAPMVHPIISENSLKGHVIHIDHYGNVYTNITERLFRQHQARRKFSIMFKRASNVINQISDYYTDVTEGERLAMFGSNGLLMLAINGGVNGHGGGAAQLFGIHAGDMVTVEYYDDKNR
ncbi:MAG: SAM-dependent chlorinase/fluorinase [Flavobacteriales bacterium]|nr:SAM-dependent chlorinase/fluorinase [Flavobacteriales bacterium]